MPDNKVFLGVIGRCTGSAWEALKTLRNHPQFDELVKMLTEKQGTILEHDVNNALYEVTSEKC